MTVEQFVGAVRETLAEAEELIKDFTEHMDEIVYYYHYESE